jgi:hypothetical protein
VLDVSSDIAPRVPGRLRPATTDAARYAKRSALVGTVVLEGAELGAAVHDIVSRKRSRAVAAVELALAAIPTVCTVLGPVVSPPWSLTLFGVSIAVPVVLRWLMDRHSLVWARRRDHATYTLGPAAPAALL